MACMFVLFFFFVCRNLVGSFFHAKIIRRLPSPSQRLLRRAANVPTCDSDIFPALQYDWQLGCGVTS